MERFYDNEDEEEYKDSYYEEEGDIEEEEEELVNYIDSKGMIDVMQMDLDQSKINLEVLEKSIEMLNKNFFWKFKNQNDKIKEIKKTYEEFLNLIYEINEENIKKEEE